MRRALLVLISLLSVVTGLALASCAQPEEPALEVSPTAATLVTGETMQLLVNRRFPGGPAELVTERVTYATSNRAIATVSSTGVVTAGDQTGLVVVRVTDRETDATATARLTVASASIRSIDVVPSPAVVLRPGTSARLTATARMSDGTTRDVTQHVLWASSNVGAAAVGVTPPDLGLVTAVSLGETTITATDAATLVQGRTIVFVAGEAPALLAIQVAPNPAAVGVGATQQLTASGVYADGTTKDLTKTLAWTSGAPTIATVDAAGLVTGVAAGHATISAADPSGAVRGSAGLDVSP